MNSTLTASKPATVTLEDGTEVEWRAFAFFFAGVLSHTMLPSDSVMPSEQITAAIEAFELSAEDLR